MRAHLPIKRLLGAGAAGAALLAAALGTAAVHAAPTSGGIATYAELPGVYPTYIFPLESGGVFTVANGQQFSYQMWRPLYWFGANGKAQLNPTLSLANPATFAVNSSHETVATITLKSYKWSDGQPVTTRDATFWINLLRANPQDWGASVPGDWPFNIKSVAVASPTKMSITFKGVYSPYWLQYNELSQIIPMPQHVWDETSASGPVGNYDQTTSGAQAVYKFLDSESKITTTYTTNPLWQVVDGPFKLSTYLPATGYTAMVPNSAYSGPEKPTIAKVVLQPYTSDTAEYDALRSGQVDFGYIPIQDIAQKSLLAHEGWTLVPNPTYTDTYFPYNFHNPKTGPIFKQLYIRQAIQHMVNQPAIIKDIEKGYAAPGYGPVPQAIANPFVDSFEKDNPYPYSPSAAKSLLASHGWTVRPSGVSTCAKPGTGSHQCGSGIAKGTSLSFNLQYSSGQVATTQIAEELQSAASLAGIKLNLSQAPFGTVITTAATPCTKTGGPGCKWDMQWWGVWSFEPDYEPTGGELWASHGAANYGTYASRQADLYISATHASPSLTAMHKYENYLALNLPVVWLPEGDYLNEVSPKLHGAISTANDPYFQIYPQDWSLSS
ncbi:MAG TPA: ABC transporter substrate-binding protein [Verrucomicrobiae bacterium]|nr:ABC transporter substrate-binding protein [Verrucomicrobiae bacterium]